MLPWWANKDEYKNSVGINLRLVFVSHAAMYIQWRSLEFATGARKFVLFYSGCPVFLSTFLNNSEIRYKKYVRVLAMVSATLGGKGEFCVLVGPVTGPPAYWRIVCTSASSYSQYHEVRSRPAHLVCLHHSEGTSNSVDWGTRVLMDNSETIGLLIKSQALSCVCESNESNQSELWRLFYVVFSLNYCLIFISLIFLVARSILPIIHSRTSCSQPHSLYTED